MPSTMDVLSLGSMRFQFQQPAFNGLKLLAFFVSRSGILPGCVGLDLNLEARLLAL